MQSHLRGVIKALRVLGNGKESRINFIKQNIPQQLKEGLLLASDGGTVGSWNGKDAEIYPVDLIENQKVTTDAFLNKVLTPVETFLGLNDPSDDGSSDAGEDAPDEAPTEAPPADPNEVVGSSYPKFEKAIKKGKLEKAKGLLDDLGKDHPDYKKYKKILKN